MRKRIGRAGAAVAAMASVGMGLGLAAGAAPAGAATAAAGNALTGIVQQVESLACLVVDIATGQPPPYGPPGDVCAN